MTLLRNLTLALAAAFGFAGTGSAQSYSHRWYDEANSTFLGTTYTPTVGVNGTFTLGLYLQADAGTTSLNTDRLFSFGARIEYSNPTNGVRVGTANAAAAAADAQISRNALFTSGNYVREFSNVSPAPYFAQVSTSATGLGLSSVAGDGGGNVLLARFTFTVAGTEGSTITSMISPAPIDDSNYLGTNVNIDNLIQGASLNVAPVPEPATVLGLCAVAAFGVRIVRRRRVLA